MDLEAFLLLPKKSLLITDDIPHHEMIRENASEWMGDGGSCIAEPSGKWIIPPLAHEEKLLVAEVEMQEVLRERHNFDPSGHYSRPDVLSLYLNQERQKIIR